MPINININRDKNSNQAKGSTILLFKGNNSILTKSVNLYFPSFSNLISTREDSFELISSYENLNKITRNRYIKNQSLQSKIKNILINEYTSSNARGSSSKNKSKIKNLLKEKVKKGKNSLSNENLKKEANNGFLNTLDISKLNSNMNINKTIDNKEKKFENVKIRRHKSTKNVLEKKKSKVNLKFIEIINKNKNSSKSSNKRRKTELFSVNRKLNMISKNMEGANKNINNPEEFYMDFFNNIISKVTTLPDNPQGKKGNMSEKNSPTNKKFIKNTTTSSDDLKFKKKRKGLKLNIENNNND